MSQLGALPVVCFDFLHVLGSIVHSDPPAAYLLRICLIKGKSIRPIQSPGGLPTLHTPHSNPLSLIAWIQARSLSKWKLWGKRTSLRYFHEGSWLFKSIDSPAGIDLSNSHFTLSQVCHNVYSHTHENALGTAYWPSPSLCPRRALYPDPFQDNHALPSPRCSQRA